MGVKIKTEFLDTVIGFNNSALPLGKRKDLHILAQMAKTSNDPSLLNLFEELPAQKELNQIKEEKLLEETAHVSKKQTKKPRTKTAAAPDKNSGAGNES
ncbi:MAG: hypothetical protein L0G11_05195 [Chryseobacterium sp.]|nr:hypothetical protein [Chryseobacterium sp.]